MDHYLVLDIGGSHIKYAVMTEESILEKGEVVTPLDTSEHLIETLVTLIRRFEGRVKGLAMSVPGRINTREGIMHTGGYLGFIHDFPMVAELSKHTSLHITIENDAKCAAKAELWKGSMKGIDTGLVVVLGSGIGGSVIINGRLHTGSTFAAGEISWLPINLIHIGTEEPFMWAHLNGTMGLTDVYEAKAGLPYHSISGKAFFEKVHAQDPLALDILEQFAESFVLGIIGIQSVLDCERIAVGGGISAQDILIRKLQEHLTAFFERYHRNMPLRQPELVRCAFANDSNLYGALYHHLYA